ncbi:SPOC like C-terminal domain-containing protein [Podospora aff. communis PSN243]|uniref:ATP-dependent DNA helicase II subunit 1 n=1 Tax=Podospora aff. communis PSN243 TaxID=3040156 RepID=A0AAV9H2A3_9PEZI|nr:SPOC like C-terminal domain-containing protein [Podospora aff. communis PSN243]
MAWGGDEERRPEEEQDEELDETDYKTQKDAVLFAIDVSNSMLEPPPASSEKRADRDTAVKAALKCAYQIMQQRIIAQPKDMMGILLFGTEKSKFRDEPGSRNSTGYPHCYLLTDLDVPAAEDVKRLKELVEKDGEDLEEILVPSIEPALMSNVLFCANQVFTTNAANFGSRRLFIITDEDSPHGGDKTAKSSAAVRAKDLYDLGVVIELFPISRGGRKFDVSKFYDDIIYRDPAAEAGVSDEVKASKSGDGLTLLNSLISNINSKQTPKRAYFSNLGFELAPGLTISVNGYMPLHRQTPARTCYVWLDGETAQLAQSETSKIDESARTVEKSEIRKAYKFGGEYIYFNPEEAKELKKMGGKGLRIIGFKPRSMLPIWASVKKSTFIFPSEQDYVGSTRVFSALWQKLLKDKKMGLAWFIARENAHPLLVAILPSQNSDDTHFLPAGLWLYPLPFADDVRSVDLDSGPRASDDLTDGMREVVKLLQLPKGFYNPAKYPNPSLQWHYRIVQAMALEEDIPEHPEDATVPRYKQMDKRVGEYLGGWKAELAVKAKGLMHSKATKRELDADDERPAKRPKAAAAPKKPSGSMNNAQLKTAIEQDTLKKLTVAELKEILASKGISTTGKKADLLEKLEQWVEENA